MTRSLNLGMRILSVVLCLVCFLSMAQPAAAVEAATEESAGQTLTTVVHLRASSGSMAIGQIENGTEVKVLSTRRTYYKIDCYDMKGYIAKSQIVKGEDGKYYVNCQPNSSETRVMKYTDHAEALELRQSLMELARKNLGYRYRYGGTRPGGFDCSGLMYYLYGEHGTKLRRTAAQQLQDGIVVPKEGMQVGDLVFFYEPGRTYPASHVGIYIGNNKIIHSGSRGTEIADLRVDYYVDYFLCVRRIINTGAAQLETPTVSAGSVLTANSVSGRTAN